VVGVTAGSWEIPFVVFCLVIVVRISATMINLISNAIFGFPFIYDTKIRMLEAKRERNSDLDH